MLIEKAGRVVSQGDKVALFLPSLVGGGAERIIVNLANGMQERGLEVDLVLASAHGPYLKEVAPGVNLVDFGVNRVLASLFPLVKYLRRERPVALISALNHVNVVALWAKRLARVDTRIVVTEHNSFSFADYATKETLRKGKATLFAMRHFYRWADLVVGVSQGVVDDVKGLTELPSEQLRVIFNPVISETLLEKANEPLGHPWFAEHEPPVILAVGRLELQKDFTTLIKAFGKLRSKMNARLVILGEGAERDKLEKLIKHLDLEEDVSLPGFVSNPYAYMKQANLFVLSSVFEGLPTVLIEALAVGTPIVSTDCESGPREILEGGKHGVLVPVQDVDALSRAMSSSLIMPGRRVDKEVLYPYTETAAVSAYLEAAKVKGLALT